MHEPHEAFAATRRTFQTAAGELAPECIAACAATPQQIADRRRRGWTAALADARAVSPWHAERLAAVADGARPDDVPTTTKDDVRSNFDRIVAEPRCALAACEAHLAAVDDRPAIIDGEYLVVTSGGTTGRPGVFPMNRRDAVDLFLGAARWVVRGPLGGQPPRRVTSVGARSPRHATAAVALLFGDADSGSGFPVDLPVSQIVARLNRLQPDMIVVYASMLPILADEAAAGRLGIRPRAVCPVAEPLPAGGREAALSAWGMEPLTIYATSEIGVVACGCGAAPGMHVNEDLLLVEPVDADRRPIAPGQRSAKVLVTRLDAGHILPLIRYELADEVVLADDGPCACGSTFRRLTEVVGRADDLLVWGDTTVHPHVVRSALAAHAGVLEYQVRVTPCGADIDVRRSDRDRPDLAAVHTDLRRVLARAGLHDPEINLNEVSAVNRTAIGKLRQFVPLADADQGGRNPPPVRVR